MAAPAATISTSAPRPDGAAPAGAAPTVTVEGRVDGQPLHTLLELALELLGALRVLALQVLDLVEVPVGWWRVREVPQPLRRARGTSPARAPGAAASSARWA